MSGGSRPNQFCKFAVVGHTYYILYIVMCDINMTTFDIAWLWGSRIFQGDYFPLWGGPINRLNLTVFRQLVNTTREHAGSWQRYLGLYLTVSRDILTTSQA